MKVSISVGGRFHGFNMASYFQDAGILHELVTGYPKMTVKKFGIPTQKIKSIYVNEIIGRLTSKLGIGYPFNFIACELYDYITARTIKKDADVYFLWSGFALKTIRSIRKHNKKAKIVLVRGSAHISDQEQLLRKIDGTTKQQIDLRMVKKEINEYDESDYITVPSKFAFDSFISQGITKDKLFLNILGVDLSEFPFKKKEPQEKLNIGYAGIISQQKNVKGIITAIENLNKIEDKFVLHIAGDFDTDYADLNLFKAYPFINYVGRLPQDKLYGFYNKIDVFVLNSVQDGFGMVILQAMSCGCAIIATTNTGGPDVIKDYQNGIIIPIMDDESLMEALSWFEKHKTLIPSMALMNREITEKGFTWEDFGQRNLNFITKITAH
ncbi:MAG: glycosyltransferase family 1 protein [Pedobacter sp.]|nr:MAG: glycosyltransferase family 1 protein [Pedobacter sp.]